MTYTDHPEKVEILKQGIRILSGLGEPELYYARDIEGVKRLDEKSDWEKQDVVDAMLIFHRHRLAIIYAGVDYHALFPKVPYISDPKRDTVYRDMEYLQRLHNIRPPFCFDLMPVEDLEKWVVKKLRGVAGG